MEVKTSLPNVLRAWREADTKQKQMLENLYGSEIFKNQNVCDRVKSYEDACIENGEDPIDENELIRAGFTRKEIIGRMLDSITKALNGGKDIDIYSGEKRWFPVFTKNSSGSFSFCFSRYYRSAAYLGTGSRLCFHEEEKSTYAGKQFKDLIIEYIS